MNRLFFLIMDFFAHALWSAAIFWGSQVWLAIFFGIMPDLLPFGTNIVLGIFKKERLKPKSQQEMQDYYDQPENQWVYKFYNWTHSIVIWAVVFVIAIFIERANNSFPYYLFAWLIHILMDIPTHTKAFFAPQFLTPVSKFCIDGKSWAHPAIMILNYGSLIAFALMRFVFHLF